MEPLAASTCETIRRGMVVRRVSMCVWVCDIANHTLDVQSHLPSGLRPGEPGIPNMPSYNARAAALFEVRSYKGRARFNRWPPH